MELISFERKVAPNTEESKVIVIPAPEENDEKVSISPITTEQKVETQVRPEVSTKMIFTVIPIRGDNIKVSKEQAIIGLQDGTYKRIAVTSGNSKKSATVDRFNCEPYEPFQIFDTKVHNVGGCQSAVEAIELAELSALVDEE